MAHTKSGPFTNGAAPALNKGTMDNLDRQYDDAMADVAGLYAPKWQPNTVYAAGQAVLSPATGVVVTAKTAHTSGATFSGTSTGGNWNTSQNAQIASLLASMTNTAANYALNQYIIPTYPGTGPIASLGGTDEPHVRSAAMAAFTLAALIQNGSYNPTVTGVDQPTAQTQAIRLITEIAAEHKANGGGWGGATATTVLNTGGDQPPLWAYYTAAASYLLWGQLSTTVQTQVKAMVNWEATRVITTDLTVWYWKTKAGVETYAGDTKGEELAWDAACVILAMILDPTNTNAAKYYRTIVSIGLMFNAKPSDLTDTVRVNGISPSVYLNGTNINDDGTVVNHTRVHPNYMVSPASSLYGALGIAWIAGVAIPGVMTRHADLIYQALTTRKFQPGDTSLYLPGGPVIAPGGTIYQWPVGTGDIYYPQGTDQQTHRTEDKAIYDVAANRYGWDNAVNQTAAFWAITHLTYAQGLQARQTTGAMYLSSENDSTEAELVVAANLATGLLMHAAPAPNFDWSPLVDQSSWTNAITSIAPDLWWRLSLASGTAIPDASGSSHTATISGTTPTYQAGSLVPSDSSAQSLQVAGGTMAMQNSYSMTWSAGYVTVGCIVKMSANPTVEAFLFGRNSTGTGELNGGVAWALQVKTNGTLHALVYDASFALHELGPTAASIANGVAHLITMTISSTGAVLYLDGTQVGSWSGAYNQASAANYSALAHDTTGGIANGLTGQLADVFATTNLLSAQGHADLYKAFTG